MRMPRKVRLLFAAPLLFLCWQAAFAQQNLLTLPQAAALSLDKSPERRISQADVDLAKSATRQARTALWPSLSFSEAVTRGNDPVYAFGTRLRQQRFEQSDFAPNRLNRPLPMNDFTSRFTGQWLAFDSLH